MAPPGSNASVLARSRFADLGPRLVSASILLVITVAAVWLNGVWFAALTGVVFAWFYREWEIMIAASALCRSGVVLTGLMALVPLAAQMGGWGAGLLIVLAALAVTPFCERHLIGWRLVGVTFTGLVVIALIGIRGTDMTGFAACFFLGATVWMTDTGAFFAGRKFGGAKLNPEISPAKTWSGAFGGLIAGTIAGLIVWAIATGLSTLWIGLIIAILVSLAGQAGDLTESAIKRYFRIKDSGDIIPGHGGVMDRLDSLTFGALLVFLIGAWHAGPDQIATGLLIW